MLTGAAEVYAAEDPGIHGWYHGDALALLYRSGADLDAARKARRERKGSGFNAG